MLMAKVKLKEKEILELFVNRKDVYAVKVNSHLYIPVEKDFGLDNISKHLKGERNYGIYQLDVDNTVKWACIDVDDKNQRDILVRIGEKIKVENPEIRIFLEESNRGFHLWICYGKKVQAKEVRCGVSEKIAESELIDYELFPKQTELNENRKYGNLVNLPYAVHPETGWENTMEEILIELKGGKI